MNLLFRKKATMDLDIRVMMISKQQLNRRKKIEFQIPQKQMICFPYNICSAIVNGMHIGDDRIFLYLTLQTEIECSIYYI